MVEVRLEGIAKRYGETVALDDVSFAAADGEFFTLVGPSGCGKTTTLRTIAGFEAPTEGRVCFGGEDVTDRPPEDRDVGIVFQSYALFPHMSVAENVGYGLRFRDPPGDATDDERVADLLDLVDLAGMGDRDPRELSGGQRQRVALARALAPGPSVLLLDEPMSALDARLRETLRRQVKAIQSELGITTVYVTHDQEEALAVSDRVAVMHEGRIEQTGSPRAVYRRPASRFVASFVGENNLFEGTVIASQRDRVRVQVGDRAFLVDGDPDRAGGPTTRAIAGESVTLCVRPESLSPSAERNRIDVAVEDWEFLGEAVRVHGTWNGRRVVVRVRDPPEGDALSVGFDPADARLL
jgi:thiamine transport system ATP-binding protein